MCHRYQALGGACSPRGSVGQGIVPRGAHAAPASRQTDRQTTQTLDRQTERVRERGRDRHTGRQADIADPDIHFPSSSDKHGPCLTTPLCADVLLPPRQIETLVVAGGVACNQEVRGALSEVAEKAGLRLVCPPPRLCTDNGVMVAWAGMERCVEDDCLGLEVQCVKP